MSVSVGQTSAEDNTSNYCTISPLRVWHSGSLREQSVIFGLWFVLLLVCVALGLASVIGRWSGLPIHFGGVAVYITIYPPLLICLCLTLMFGWIWGAIPAYFATLALALYAGMPLAWAALFACANPLGFAVMALGYQAISVRRDLANLSSLLFYIQLSFVASIFSSSGALVWCYLNRIDRTALLPIWQGWWLGGFLQSVLIVGPLMAIFWPKVARWQVNYARFFHESKIEPRRSVFLLLGSVSIGVLIYGFITIALAGTQLENAAFVGVGSMAEPVAIMQQTMWVFYWVLVLLTSFIAFFGYQLFIHWQDSTNQLLAQLQQANLTLAEQAKIDVLSGLFNRRATEEYLQTEWNRAQRIEDCAALIMLDIDHFKQVNDRFGHAAGDAAIRCLATLIMSVKRDLDIAGRYGGEEFVIILPHVDEQGAWAFAERLRELVAQTLVPYDSAEFKVTISLGVAMSDLADRDPAQWLERADRALYRAKNTGRNKAMLVMH